MGLTVSLASQKFHFITVYDNLLEDPSNNKSTARNKKVKLSLRDGKNEKENERKKQKERERER